MNVKVYQENRWNGYTFIKQIQLLLFCATSFVFKIIWKHSNVTTIKFL